MLHNRFSKAVAIIAAAGYGKRLGKTIPKQFFEIQGKPILIYTLEKFDLCNEVNEVILVVQTDQIEKAKHTVNLWHIQKVKKIVKGGDERQQSVWNGINELDDDAEIVVVHDAVRPFVSVEKIMEVIQTAKQEGAAILAVPVKNTIKRVNKGWVKETLRRDSLWSIQTPQAFRTSWIKEAYQNAFQNHIIETDDAALLEHFKYPIKIVTGEECNIKITSPMDLFIAEKFINKESD